MRILLVLLLTLGVLYAKDKDTCYSVQLASFALKEDSSYNFEEQNYPSSCKLVKFSNINAVRCGCFEKYGRAKKEQKVLRKTYKHSMIVTTYKYRFAPTKSIASKQEIQKVEPSPQFIVRTPQQEQPQEIQEENLLDDLTLQGHVNIAAQSYITKPSGKHANNYTASAEIESAYHKDDFRVFAKLRAQQDYYDLKGTAEHNDRSYLRAKELYATYDFPDSQLFFGKNIRFWGALEVKNITDGFNLSDFRSDPTENDKMGSWNAAYTYYTDDAEIAAIVKFYEQDRKMPAYPYVYYPFTNQLIVYDQDIKTEYSRYRPSIFLKYSATADTEYALDYSFIIEHGYDSQRYYNAPNIPEYKVYEHAYLVNKLITYNTLVVDSTLYKLEAVFADVCFDKKISDYYHLGLGVEHTLTQVYKEADLGLLMEYYKYGTLQDGRYSDLELFEVFQNDLFIGGRYSFNEGNDASIVGGAIFDLDYNEQVYYVKYESRINDIFKLHLDYRQSEPSKSYETALKRMGKQKRVSIKAGYYF
ncbi:MAG: hypothetical protein ABXS93_05285 [Sulfurimonas sp.]